MSQVINASPKDEIAQQVSKAISKTNNRRKNSLEKKSNGQRRQTRRLNDGRADVGTRGGCAHAAENVYKSTVGCFGRGVDLVKANRQESPKPDDVVAQLKAHTSAMRSSASINGPFCAKKEKESASKELGSAHRPFGQDLGTTMALQAKLSISKRHIQHNPIPSREQYSYIGPGTSESTLGSRDRLRQTLRE